MNIDIGGPSGMIPVRAATPDDRERWDAYVLAHPESHFGQRWGWIELTERSHAVTRRAWLAEDAGVLVGVLPLFEKRGGARELFSSPGGLLARDAGVAGALLVPARDVLASGRHAWIELRDQQRAWPGLETSTEHVTMVLELEASPEAQWKTFDAKLRNQIRKGEKARFAVTWGPEQVGAFHRVMLENLRDLGTPVRNEAYFRFALEKLGGAGNLLVIAKDGVPAGCMFTVSHAATFADPWASSLRRHLALCPNQVLYWSALERAIALGHRRFDFGRSQWNSGTFRFKEQWGAKPVQLHYQYVLGTAKRIPTLADQKSGFDLAVRVWKKLPLAVAGVLGEPAKRMFPEAL